jgi:tritrans,polycis-undecaprenyl-diphosphate synthase [geranylgeranyl-diphosphate specific]
MLQQLLSSIGVYKLYHAWLKRQIDTNRIPEHIGVILDGNRRWAISKNMISWQGHEQGAKVVSDFLQWCLDLNIRTVTIYAFSTENFKRSEKELEELMKIYEDNLEKTLNSNLIHDYQVKITVIGRTSLLNDKLQKLIQKAAEATEKYDRYYLNIALAYGGRAEIVDATRSIAKKIQKGELQPSEIDEAIIDSHLYTAHLPKPDLDLVIRSSGESRLSNFLIWQAAYSEFFLVDVYWPEFREIDLLRAIRSYQKRKRRYGK